MQILKRLGAIYKKHAEGAEYEEWLDYEVANEHYRVVGITDHSVSFFENFLECWPGSVYAPATHWVLAECYAPDALNDPNKYVHHLKSAQWLVMAWENESVQEGAQAYHEETCERMFANSGLEL